MHRFKSNFRITKIIFQEYGEPITINVLGHDGVIEIDDNLCGRFYDIIFSSGNVHRIHYKCVRSTHRELVEVKK